MKNQVISELKPKADYTDTILQSKALVNINVSSMKFIFNWNLFLSQKGSKPPKMLFEH